MITAPAKSRASIGVATMRGEESAERSIARMHEDPDRLWLDYRRLGDDQDAQRGFMRRLQKQLEHRGTDA